MESTLILNHSLTAPKDQIYSPDLLSTLEYYADKIQILSLDCFDTLLWRRTAIPIDVFYDLQQKPTFKSIKFDPFLRVCLEGQTRNLKAIQGKTNEVKLHDIYKNGFPNLSKQQLDALAEEELEAEMDACYVHPPMINLIRTAHNRGIKIIIVSNTYLDKNQLRRLLAHQLPQDVMAAISEIYCSCEYNVSKNNGLFKHVLNKTGIKPESILHIGDNIHADLFAAREHGLHAHQLIQYDENIAEFLRLHAVSASIFNPNIRHKQALISPFRSIYANTKIDTPEKLIGYASIGPLMYAFSEFITDEIAQLKNSGKNPKVLFLMRDAYLPSLACEALNEKSIGKNVQISRFASYAATFRSKDDIDKYLSEMAISRRFQEMAKQFLLPNEIIEPLIDVVTSSESPVATFIQMMQREDIQNIVINNSAQYRERLIKYLKKQIDLNRGDTLVFIDLGYSGTAQRQLEPVLRDELGIELQGRYLIQLNVPDWEKSRRGLIDPSWCDDRAMLALVNYIALLEQICTSNEKSVVDYDENGDPIFSKNSLSENQYTKLDNIQKECLRFIKDAKHFFSEAGKLSIKILRETTLAELGRLIFLPTENEIKYLESFQFDLNMGTNDVLKVFNQNEGLNSLRKRGIFFTETEKNMKTIRTNFPAELRSAGLELAMTLMAKSRFGIELGYKDMSLRREQISISVIENGKTNSLQIEAMLTYDGYYAITLPIRNHGFHINILFGQKYHWIEFNSAELIEMDAFLNNVESLYTKDYWQNLGFQDMSCKAGMLYECASSSSSVIIPPANNSDNKNYIVRIVFRPIVSR